MASSNTEDCHFLDVIPFLECPVCYKQYDRPNMLPCQHVYCTKCLEKLMHNGIVICPVCRREHVVLNGDVTTIPVDLTLTKLSDLAKIQQQNQTTSHTASHKCNSQTTGLVLQNLVKMTQGYFYPVRDLIENLLVDSEEHVKSLQERVEYDFAMIVEALLRRKQRLLKEICSKEGKQEKGLNEKLANLENTEKSVTSFRIQRRRRLDESDCTEDLFRKINERIQHVKTLADSCAVIETKRIKFDMKWSLERETNNIKDIITAIETLGQLQSSEETHRVYRDESDSSSNSDISSSGISPGYRSPSLLNNASEQYSSSCAGSSDSFDASCNGSVSNKNLQGLDFPAESNITHVQPAHNSAVASRFPNQNNSKVYIPGCHNNGDIDNTLKGKDDVHLPTLSKVSPPRKTQSNRSDEVGRNPHQEAKNPETILDVERYQREKVHFQLVPMRPKSDNTKLQVKRPMKLQAYGSDAQLAGSNRKQNSCTNERLTNSATTMPTSSNSQSDSASMCVKGFREPGSSSLIVMKPKSSDGSPGSANCSAQQRLASSAPSQTLHSQASTPFSNRCTSSTDIKPLHTSLNLAGYQKDDRLVFYKPGSHQLQFDKIKATFKEKKHRKGVSSAKQDLKKVVNSFPDVKPFAGANTTELTPIQRFRQLDETKFPLLSLRSSVSAPSGERVTTLTAVAQFGKTVLGFPNLTFMLNTSNVAVTDECYNTVKVFDTKQKYKHIRSINLTDSEDEAKATSTCDMCSLQQSQFAVSDSAGKVVKIYEEKQQQCTLVSQIRQVSPRGITCDKEQNMYVCDTDKRCVNMFPRPYSGSIKCSFFVHGKDCQFPVCPSYIAVSEDGRIAISDQENHCVFVYHDHQVSKIGGRGNGEGFFDTPCGLVFDVNGYLIVADSKNHRLQIFAQNNCFLEAVGGKGNALGKFNNPKGLAVSKDKDFLFVCDTGNNRMQVFSLHIPLSTQTITGDNLGNAVWV